MGKIKILKMISNGLQMATATGISMLITGIAADSRKDKDDGFIGRMLVGIGAAGISMLVTNKVCEHLDKQLMKSIEHIESEETEEQISEEGKA